MPHSSERFAPTVLKEDGYPVIVVIDGTQYGCTGNWDLYNRMEHSNITCPVHEDEDSPAYVGLEGLRVPGHQTQGRRESMMQDAERVPSDLRKEVERALCSYGDGRTETEDALTRSHEALEALWFWVRHHGGGEP